MKIAAVDVGTNSTRLIIVQFKNESYKVLERELTITRLGEGVDENNFLKKEAIERTVNALQKYDQKINKYNVKHTKVVGTSALRDVNNKDDFIKLLREKTSLKLKIISGNKEAKYIYKGVKTDISNKDLLIIDIGGGSTEFIWKKKNKIIEKSLNIGAVRLTERIIEDNKKPLTKKNYRSLIQEINNVLENNNITEVKINNLIGVGGTITTLAAMNLGLEIYDSKKIHKHILEKRDVDRIFNKLSQSSFVERKKMTGLNEKRADIIIAGVVILKVIMEMLAINDIQISERDILFGLIDEALGESR